MAVIVMALESDIIGGSLLARVESTGGKGVMFSVPKILPLFEKGHENLIFPRHSPDLYF